jgi:general secretion pathway protein I
MPDCRGTSVRSGSRGFTLVEVLVALLLVALALAALVRTAGTEARNLATLREATLAQWVASNVIAEARLQQVLPDAGRSEGQADMGGLRWRWRMVVQGTDLPEVRRMDVQVFAEAGDEADQPAATLTGFATLP